MQIDSIAPKFQITPLSSGIRADEGAALPIPGVGSGAQNGVGAVEGTGKSFGEFLQHAIAEVNDAQLKAGDLSTRFAAGEPMDVHQVMIAGQEASVALNMALQVRNKLVEAYQEVMRVNV